MHDYSMIAMLGFTGQIEDRSQGKVSIQMEAELTQLTSSPITAVAWKKDRSAVAISPNNETILVYHRSAENKWILKDTLVEHDQRITGLDWYSGPSGDRILSCSADRNAYVWSKESSASGQWKPSLVLLRFKRAATCAQWTADGTKFAVGGSEGLVAVGHFDPSNDWWVCKHLKKVVDGPVLTIAWHPAGTLVGVSTLHGSLHLVSAFIPEVDSGKTINIPWVDEATSSSFDSECFSVQVGCWVYAIAFSRSGNTMAWSNQQAIVTVYYPASGHQSSVQCLTEGKRLPLQNLLFLSENVLMAAGYSGIPILLSGADGKDWSVKQELSNGSVSTGASPSKPTSIVGKMAKFQMIGQTGEDNSATSSIKSSNKSKSMHISAISSLEEFEGQRQISKVASIGLDGRMVIWSVGKLASQFELEATKL